MAVAQDTNCETMKSLGNYDYLIGRCYPKYEGMLKDTTKLIPSEIKRINKSKIIKRLYEIKTNLFYEEQNQKYDKKIQELKSHYNHFFIFQKSKESNKSFEETKKMCDGIIENEMFIIHLLQLKKM